MAPQIRYMTRSLLISFMTFHSMTSTPSMAKSKRVDKSKSTKPPATAPVESPTANPIDGNVPDDVVAKSSTKIDFSETSIDGKMKAPEGFFLKGQNTNSLSQMVKLRSNFREELRNSQSAVKSHIR
jgi:hypothetical protein